MILLMRKLNRRPNDVTFNLWKGEVWGFKVSWDDEAPLPRGIACATRSIRAPLNAGLMMDSTPPLPSLQDVWQPSTVSFTITVLAINSFQFTARVTTAWELALCFLEWRLHFSGLYVLAQSALWFQGNDHLPSLLASSRSKPKPLLVSPRRHITWSLFQLLFSATHKLRLNTFHFWDILISSTLPPPLSSTVWEVGKTNLSFLAGGEECQLPSITLVDVRKHSELLSNVWVIFLSFWESKNRVKWNSKGITSQMSYICPCSSPSPPSPCPQMETSPRKS